VEHPYAKKAFSREERDALKRYKREIDPKGILNPGKFFSLATRIPLLERVMGSRLIAPLLGGMEDEKGADVIRDAYESCTHCGACVSVCPAVVLLGDERLSPRAKLFYAHILMEGKKLDTEEGSRLMLCLHCGQCEKVCQAGLNLRVVWEILEEMLSGRYLLPTEDIERLIRLVESEESYRKLADGGVLHG